MRNSEVEPAMIGIHVSNKEVNNSIVVKEIEAFDKPRDTSIPAKPKSGDNKLTASLPLNPAMQFVEDRSNYDSTNSAFMLLQPPSEELSHLPLDNYGAVDWVKALSSNAIDPRRSLLDDKPMKQRTTDILMKETYAMPHVLFPHAQHTEWLDCTNCHPKPFKMVEGSSKITMDDIMRGDACGLCHDRVAFSILACERCHSVTHPGSPNRWW